MKKISLNEELLNQIRLINFDRSKTLMEQEPTRPPGPRDYYKETPRSVNNKYDSKETLTPEQMGLFGPPTPEGEKTNIWFAYSDKPIQSGYGGMTSSVKVNYPGWCRYPKQAVTPSDTLLPQGYCAYDGYGKPINIPMGAFIKFEDLDSINRLKNQIAGYYMKNWESATYDGALNRESGEFNSKIYNQDLADKFNDRISEIKQQILFACHPQSPGNDENSPNSEKCKKTKSTYYKEEHKKEINYTLDQETMTLKQNNLQPFEEYISTRIEVPKLEKRKICEDFAAKQIQKLNPIPDRTVSYFIINNRPYIASYEINNNGWEFNWYFQSTPEDVNNFQLGNTDRIKTGNPYEEAQWVDTRKPWQKAVDEYGFPAQMIAAVGTILLTLRGQTSALLMLEIVLEGTLGAIIARREWEKGENIGAVVSIITGLLPILKTQGWYRNINKAHLESLAINLEKSNITTKTTPEELRDFYLTLSDEEQMILYKIENDPVSLGKVQEIVGDPRTLYSNLSDLAKNKEIIPKRISFWKTAGGIELISNLSVLGIGLGIEFIWGSELNDEEKKKIEWFFSKIPKSHQDYYFSLIATNPILKENINQITDLISKNAKVDPEALSSMLNEYAETLAKENGVALDKTVASKFEKPTDVNYEMDLKAEKNLDYYIKKGYKPYNGTEDLTGMELQVMTDYTLYYGPPIK